MILQQYADGGERYSEADCISLYIVDISCLDEKTEEKVLEHLMNKVPCCKGHIIIDNSHLFDTHKLEKCNKINVVVMSDGEEKSNYKVILLDENANAYLLNNSGKTIKKF